MANKIETLENLLEQNCEQLALRYEMTKYDICEMIVNSVDNPDLHGFLVESVDKSIRLLKFKTP